MLEKRYLTYLIVVILQILPINIFAISSNSVTETNHEELAALGLSIWKNFTINVCWENPNGFSSERIWVKNKIADTWEANSNLRFVGWGDCTVTSDGIRISIADEISHTKGLGVNLNAKSKGMVLNFIFDRYYSEDCQLNRKSCIEWHALHEFGHVLGFTHEHNRHDQPDYVMCKNKSGTTGDINLTPYDLHSIMNYCHPDRPGRPTHDPNKIELSRYDIIGLQLCYGSPILSRTAVTKELLDSKIYPSMRQTVDNSTVLMHAAQNGYIDVVKEFLKDRRVDPNVQNSKGQTALMFAAGSGHTDVVRELLENQNKSDPNILTKEDVTALMYASRMGHVEIVNLLVNKGADIKKTTLNGEDALGLAIMGYRNVNPQSADQYIATEEIDIGKIQNSWAYMVIKPELDKITGKIDRKILHDIMAVYRERFQKIEKLLIENGADLNIVYSIGHSSFPALMWAANMGDLELIKLLLHHGADPYASYDAYKDGRKFNAIQMARYVGYEECARFLESVSAAQCEG